MADHGTSKSPTSLTHSEGGQKKRPANNKPSGETSGFPVHHHRRANSTGTYLLSYDSAKLIRDLANAMSATPDSARALPPMPAMNPLAMEANESQSQQLNNDQDASYPYQQLLDEDRTVLERTDATIITENNTSLVEAESACGNTGASRGLSSQSKILKLLRIIRGSKHELRFQTWSGSILHYSHVAYYF